MIISICLDRELVDTLERMHNHVVAAKHLYDVSANTQIYLDRVTCKIVVDRIYAGRYTHGTSCYCRVSWQIVDPTQPMVIETEEA